MSRTQPLELATREVMVRDWVRRKLGSVAHELRVARVAKLLFELTRRWHNLGAADCRLLVMGCMVHDVGRALGEKKHAVNGARMVLENEMLGDAEARRLAFLTRYHKGDVPAAGEEEILSRGTDDTHALRVLLAFLRAADGLDSRSMGGPRLVMTVRNRILTVYGHVDGNVREAAALYGRPKKFRLLEEMLACEIRTEWCNTDVLAMVG